MRQTRGHSLAQLRLLSEAAHRRRAADRHAALDMQSALAACVHGDKSTSRQGSKRLKALDESLRSALE